MKKKLQVFISSTYIDMFEERQAAVTAVLNAGHIPAGMELFKSADKSQKEIIKRWIDESDVYMLILGGRYGSIDNESGKSYTHWEYDYAGEKGKRRFAIVINETKLNDKAKIDPNFMEREHYNNYLEFKKEVLSNMSKFYEDIKDIKLVTMESLKEYEDETSLLGWVRGNTPSNKLEKVLLENTKLLKDNEKLKNQVRDLQKKIDENNKIGNYTYEELVTILSNHKLKAPESMDNFVIYHNLLECFVGIQHALATGISTKAEKGSESYYVKRAIAPKLMAFGMIEKKSIPGSSYERLQTSKDGLHFLARHEVESTNIFI